MNIEVKTDWWKTLFDEIYLLTDARSVGDEELTRREVEVICELIPLNPDDKILDLCGGHGRHCLELCRRGFRKCTVLDYSHYLLKHGQRLAAQRNFRISFIRGDARETGLSSRSFEHVLILGNSLGYLPGPADDCRILGESSRLLQPGGWLLLDVPDSTTVRSRFTPNSRHEIGSEVVVCRERELRGDTIFTRELVISKKNDLIRDRCYAIRLFEPEDLVSFLSQYSFRNINVRSGFAPHKKRGDYGCMKHHLLITAQKARTI